MAGDLRLLAGVGAPHLVHSLRVPSGEAFEQFVEVRSFFQEREEGLGFVPREVRAMHELREESDFVLGTHDLFSGLILVLEWTLRI